MSYVIPRCDHIIQDTRFTIGQHVSGYVRCWRIRATWRMTAWPFWRPSWPRPNSLPRRRIRNTRRSADHVVVFAPLVAAPGIYHGGIPLKNELFWDSFHRWAFILFLSQMSSFVILDIDKLFSRTVTRGWIFLPKWALLKLLSFNLR